MHYADDFVVFTRSRRAAERVFAGLSRYLTQTLRLVVNLEKFRIAPSDGVEFLGFVFRGARATINVSEKNFQRFRRRVRALTGRSRGISMDQRLADLRRYLQGWAGYFALAGQLKLFDQFDQSRRAGIRRRLRVCFWKRWRLVRTRVRNLLALGVPRRQAIRHGQSRKGPWRMAKTIASGVGMTNAWLQSLGLVSLKSLWAKLAPLRRIPARREPACYVVWGGRSAMTALTRLRAFLTSSAFLDVANYVADSLNAFGLIVRNRQIKFFLEFHDQFNSIK